MVSFWLFRLLAPHSIEGPYSLGLGLIPWLLGMEKRLLEEPVQNDERTFVSVEGTFRARLPLLGAS